MDRRALACFLLALLLLAGCLGVALARTGFQRSGFNGVDASFGIGTVGAGRTICQHQEIVPADTGQLIASLAPATPGEGPPLTVTLRRRGRLLEQVHIAGGWADGVQVPLAKTRDEHDEVDVCFRVGGTGAQVRVGAGRTPPLVGSATLDGRPVGGSLGITYLYPQSRSWLAYVPTAMWRIGLGRGGWGGAWIAWTVLALLLAAVTLAARVTLRTIVARRPPAVRATALSIALAAFATAAAWSLVTPALQSPDEEGHVAYVQQVGEAFAPPVKSGDPQYSPELLAAMADLRIGSPTAHQSAATIATELEERRLERDLTTPLERRGNGDAAAATSQPPLYYALEAIPYTLARGATLTARMQLMRLLSALMAGATALFAFLFVRECLPRHPWAWSVGGLGVAFTPMFGFLSGTVNPDALLFAVSAALMFCLARAFRRGMTTRLAIWTGVALGAGMLAKINFYGLVPGALVAIVLAARQSEGSWNGRAARLAGTAIGIGLAPYLAMLALDALAWDRGAILFSSASSTEGVHGGLGSQLSFLWQVYLPRLPGQTPIFPDWVGYALFFKGFVGNFGALSVPFPEWANKVAFVLAIAIAGSALRAAVIQRAELRRRRAELLAYLLLTGGLLALVAIAAARGWNAVEVLASAQARYLLPLIALFGAVLALAALGGGQRWGRALGAVLVVTTIAWTLFAQLLTVEAFYS